MIHNHFTQGPIEVNRQLYFTSKWAVYIYISAFPAFKLPFLLLDCRRRKLRALVGLLLCLQLTFCRLAY